MATTPPVPPGGTPPPGFGEFVDFSARAPLLEGAYGNLSIEIADPNPSERLKHGLQGALDAFAECQQQWDDTETSRKALDAIYAVFPEDVGLEAVVMKVERWMKMEKALEEAFQDKIPDDPEQLKEQVTKWMKTDADVAKFKDVFGIPADLDCMDSLCRGFASLQAYAEIQKKEADAFPPFKRQLEEQCNQMQALIKSLRGSGAE